MPKKNIISLVGIIFLLSACSLKDETVSSPDRRVAVTKPSLWFDIDSLNDVADIKIGNPFFEAYFILIMESRSDFDDDFTLAQYSELTRSYIEEGTQKFTQSLDQSLTQINGMKAIRYEINAEVEGIKAKYWHVSVKSKKRFYQLLAWSLVSKFDSNKDNFTKVINSFHELDQVKL